MPNRRAPFSRLGRSGSAPIRRYFNEHFESVKDDLRTTAANERIAANVDAGSVRVALERLEESIGFLGMQLSLIRTAVEDDARGRVVVLSPDDEHAPDADRTATPIVAALEQLGFRRAAGSVWVHDETPASG